jgi:hypothetical protein
VRSDHRRRHRERRQDLRRDLLSQGRGPAPCGEAHDTLCSALQGGGTAIGDWTCKTDPSGDPVAACTSTSGRTIQASG